MLKKIFLFLSVVFFFSSCNVEEIDSLNDSNKSVAGVWKLTELNLENALDINDDDIFNTNILKETGIIDATINFVNDETGTILYRSWIGFSSTEKDGKLSFLPISSLSSDHAPEYFTYFIENGKMTINTDITFNKSYIEVSELIIEKNKLKLTVPNGFIVKDETTLQETVNQDLTYIFTKE